MKETSEKIAKVLLNLKQRAEKTEENIKQLSEKLSAKQDQLWSLVNDYGVKRVELLEQKFATEGLVWCTVCRELVSRDGASLLYTSGREYYEGGYQSSCYGYRPFSRLHMACSNCLQRSLNRHGTMGVYDKMAQDQSSFYAYKAEEREDGIYYYGDKGLIKLNSDEKLIKIPGYLFEKLAEEWGVPAKIEKDNNHLVVHEYKVLAKAS